MTDNDEEKKKQMSCRNKIKIVQWWKYKKIFENMQISKIQIPIQNTITKGINLGLISKYMMLRMQ